MIEESTTLHQETSKDMTRSHRDMTMTTTATKTMTTAIISSVTAILMEKVVVQEQTNRYREPANLIQPSHQTRTRLRASKRG